MADLQLKLIFINIRLLIQIFLIFIDLDVYLIGIKRF